MTEAVINLESIHKHFPIGRSLIDLIRRRPAKSVRAVDGVTLELHAGEVMAIVGESGCGKTTTANLIMGILTPTSGRVLIGGDDLSSLSGSQLRRKRRHLQIMFQDPYESLNPRMTIGQIVAEPLQVHRVTADRPDLNRRVVAALEQAGLRPAERFVGLHPHHLSGGQRQRVVIAAALALEPKVLVADEPVSMLDVSIRAEILNLLASLAREQAISVVMITHDMSTVAAYSHRIAVMYLGRVVETGPTMSVLRNPQHPYTQALVSVVPVPHPERRRQRIILSGEAPDPSRIPAGCRFHPRCPQVFEDCPLIDPQLMEAGPEHEAACLLVGRP